MTNVTSKQNWGFSVCIWIGAIPHRNQFSPWLTGISSWILPKNLPTNGKTDIPHLRLDQSYSCIVYWYTGWSSRAALFGSVFGFWSLVLLFSAPYRRMSEGQWLQIQSENKVSHTKKRKLFSPNSKPS